MQSFHLSKNLKIAFGSIGGLVATSMLFAPVFLSRMTVEEGTGLAQGGKKSWASLLKKEGASLVRKESDAGVAGGSSSSAHDVGGAGGNSLSAHEVGGAGDTSLSAHDVGVFAHEDLSVGRGGSKGGSSQTQGGGSAGASLSKQPRSSLKSGGITGGLRKSTLNIPTSLEELSQPQYASRQLTSEHLEIVPHYFTPDDLRTAITSLSKHNERAIVDETEPQKQLETIFHQLRKSLVKGSSLEDLTELELFSQLKDHFVVGILQRIRLQSTGMADEEKYSGHMYAIFMCLNTLKMVDPDMYDKFRDLMQNFAESVPKKYRLDMSRSSPGFFAITQEVLEDFDIPKIGAFKRK
jgi:hypothetical protein